MRVSVTFLAEQSEPSKERWFWAYHVRIENGGKRPVQLISREWTISDGGGARHEVQGEGVVGEQPLIEPGRVHEYQSFCVLKSPSGSMEGHYEFVRADGTRFDAAIPRFELDAER